MKDKVLNFHLTDYCNFRCKHCFVNMSGRSLSLAQCKSIIDNLYSLNHFTRINLAGGEPMMVEYLQELIDYIDAKGFKCSIITNGSMLSKEFILENKNKLSMIGVSVDSPNDHVNRQIGRKTIPNLVELCNTIKKTGIHLKINICVSKINLHNDFKPLIDAIDPDRLKLLKFLPSPHAIGSLSLEITDKEFEKFCNKLSQFTPVCEDNEHMRHAYWIVDSEGYFGKDNLHDSSDYKINLIKPLNKSKQDSVISRLLKY